MRAELPENEEHRMSALESYGILDTPAEQAYDDITMLASLICESPIALISLVDRDRQWFKARVGLDATETPRDLAFCAHAILWPEDVFVVTDATQDPRFSENPLVTGDPGIRFYAGASIVTPGGDPLGTVCVIDRQPRELAPHQAEALRALSRQVVTQLELRHALADLVIKNAEQEEFRQQLEQYQMQIEASYAQVALQNRLDGLTGVMNRRAFDQALQEEIARFRRSHSAFSLLMIDVDKFKSYNDEFGHVVGDDILRQVAEVIGKYARTSDTVTRYGGEEFAVILPDTGRQGAIVMADRLRRAVAGSPWQFRPVTISVGAGTASPDDTADSLIRRADAALYQAKVQGRDKCVHVEQIPVTVHAA